MTSITETLPTELTTAIIDSLASPILEGENQRGNKTYDDTLKDLKACSLACRHFVPLCQKHIFNTIELETHDTGKGLVQSFVGRFSKIVKSSPSIGGYVQNLTVWLTPDPYQDFEAYSYPATVASGLRSLTNLKTVAIAVWHEYINLDWDDVPTSLTPEFYHLFQLPTITTIRLRHIQNFPIRSVALCLGLETLTVEGCSLSDEIPSGTSFTAGPVKPIQLIHLIIVGTSNERSLISKFISSRLSCGNFIFNFGHLETLHMQFIHMEEMRAASDFLQELKPPLLRKIDIWFPADIDIDELAVLSLNSAVKVVKDLVVSFTCDTSGANDYLLGICRFLETLSNDNQVRALKICVEYLPSTFDFVDDPNWDVVNNTLLTPGWSSLTQVDFDIISFTDQKSLPQAVTRAAALKKVPRTRLRGLSSSQSLKFTWTFKSVFRDPRGIQFNADL